MKSALIQFEKTTICPLGDDRKIIKSQFREGCFVYQSFGLEESLFGDMLIKPHVSFLADNGNGKAAEWEPQYGPIQLWTECSEDWRGETANGSEIEPRSHWHFEFVENTPGNWSQLAVDQEDLKGKLSRGYIDSVFDVLLRWANN